MTREQEYWVGYIANRFSEIMDEGDLTDNLEEIYELRRWLMVDYFDREQVNYRLKQYATGEQESMLFEQEIV